MSKKAVVPFEYVERQDQLVALCKRFSSAERLAIDTEFVREKYYYARLEVLQLSDGDHIAVIDLQKVRDKEPLARLIGNPEILKIFHAADQDIEIILQDFGVVPAPMFDTQVAASMLGFGQQVSLTNLVRQALGKEAISGQSVTDWTHRPLSQEQLAYAASDVEHLHALHEALTEGLRERGREQWFLDEQAERLAHQCRPLEPDDELFRRVKDWTSMDRRQLAVLRELAAWREQQARDKNIPKRMIFTDEALVDLVKFAPTSRGDLQRLRRVNPGQANRFFDDIMAVMKRGRDLPQDQWPEKPRSERRELPTGLMEICRALLRYESGRNEIAASIVCTSGELQELLFDRDRAEERTDHPLMHGWRYELFGRRLVQLLRGELVVAIGPDGELAFEARTRTEPS